MPVLKMIMESGFVKVSNKLAQDEVLSYEAKGLMLELLSRPDNWKIKKTQLMRSHTKKHKLARMLKELRNAGYLDLIFERESDGTIIDKIWHAYGDPPKNYNKRTVININDNNIHLPDNQPKIDKKGCLPIVWETSTYKERIRTKKSIANDIPEKEDKKGDDLIGHDIREQIIESLKKPLSPEGERLNDLLNKPEFIKINSITAQKVNKELIDILNGTIGTLKDKQFNPYPAFYWLAKNCQYKLTMDYVERVVERLKKRPSVKRWAALKCILREDMPEWNFNKVLKKHEEIKEQERKERK